MKAYHRMKKDELIEEIHRMGEQLNQLNQEKSKISENSLHARYNTLTNNLDVGLYRSEIKKPFRILEANPAFLHLFGFTSIDELKSVSTKDLYVNNTDRIAFVDMLMKEGKVKNMEVWLRRKNGTKFLASISTILVRNEKNQALYFDGVIEDITEHKQAILDLLRREEQYRTLFNFSPDSISIMDERGKILEVNPAFCKLFGYSREDIIGSNITRMADPTKKNEVRANIKRILNGENLKQIVRNNTKNKKEKYIQLTESKILLPNGQPGILSIAEDFTDWIHTKNKLIESEQKYRLLIENQSDYIVKVDTEGRFLFVSKSYCDFFGKKEEDLLGKKFMVLVHDEDKDNTQKAMKNLYHPPFKAYLEQRAMTRHGWRWISWMDTAILNEKNEVIEIIGVGRDITERKLAEQSLLQSEESYRGLFNSVTDAIYLQDKDGRFVDVNAGAEKMYGYPRDYFIGKLPDFLAAPGMNDLEKVGTYINEAFQGIPQTFEFWGIDKNKRIFPKEVRLNKTSYFGNDVIVAFAHDISQRVKDQRLLAEKESKYRHIFNAFPDIYFKSDVSGKVLEISPSVEKITGFTPEEVIGKKSIDFYYAPEDFEAIGNHFKNDNYIHDFDTRIKMKPGGYVDCSLTASMINDPQTGLPYMIEGVLRDISERIKAERLIRENERRLSTLMSNLPGIAYQCLNDRHWTMKFVSKGSEQLTGYAPESFINNHDLAYFDIIHPDDREMVSQQVNISLKNKESFTLTYRIRTRQGKEKWVWEKGIGVKIEGQQSLILEGFISDITEQKNAEDEIRKLSRAVDQSPTLVLMTDLNGKIKYVNKQFEKTTGYLAKEVLGKNPRFLKSGSTPTEVYEKLWKTLSEGKEWHGEFLNRTKDGKHYWESANIYPLKDEYGKVIQYIGMKEDISLRKKMELELIEAKEKAEESDKLKSAFLANMSHEIRTPMNAIIGFSQLLDEPGISTKERSGYISLIQNSSNDLMTLIDDIIDISKIEADQMKIFKSQYILDNLMLELYENFRQIIKTQTSKSVLKLRYIPPDSADQVIIYTDVDRFKQIFKNLLNNAIKFTDFGSVEFGFSIKKDDKHSFFEFYVSDTGIGIPADKKELIFESFTQANDSESRLYGGTGLGLAITKKIIDILGGKIWVESKRGYGSTFYFTLPYDSGINEKKLYLKSKRLSKERFPDFSGKTILLIDFDKSGLLFLEKVLARTHCKILQANTHDQVFDTLNHNTIDLIFNDLGKEQDEGVETIVKIREKDTKIPIIGLSSYPLESEKQHCLSIGCNNYLAKPIDISDLLSTMKNHLTE